MKQCVLKLQEASHNGHCIKTVNVIRARAPHHIEFVGLLVLTDNQLEEIIYHTNVRWLSQGSALQRYFYLLQENDCF
jgi:hypothetical protein